MGLRNEGGRKSLAAACENQERHQLDQNPREAEKIINLLRTLQIVVLPSLLRVHSLGASHSSHITSGLCDQETGL